MLEYMQDEVFMYFHIPFCTSRCIYCDFLSTTDLSIIDNYFAALFNDIEMQRDLFYDKAVETLYFGGGTPSLVKESYIFKIIDKISKLAEKFHPTEITIEMNPESVTMKKLQNYKNFGINRISLGVQAFDESVLKISKRPHGEKEIYNASYLIAENFENFNFDFIVGLPGYSMKTVEKNLKLVERFNPSHVSVYILEIHENTPIYTMMKNNIIHLPKDDEISEMFDYMRDSLIEMGYEWYEISNFAKDEKFSVHNLAYWNNFDYIGLGVSAGGHYGNYRYVKTTNVKDYIKDPLKLSYENHNTPCMEFKETLFMGLRLIKGVDTKKLKMRFEKLFENFYNTFKDCQLFEFGDNIKLSDIGLNFSKTAFEKIVGWNCED